jgi:hypothetical protein
LAVEVAVALADKWLMVRGDWQLKWQKSIKKGYMK